MREKHIKPITTKEKQVLDLFLTFRYLNQTHIQLLLHHKAKERIRTRLNKLTDNKYLFRKYTNTFAPRPSVYCLNIASIPYLKTQRISNQQIRNMYYEKNRSLQFQEHCLFLATLFLSLETFAKAHTLKLRFFSKANLYGMTYLPLPHPDCFFSLSQEKKRKKRYFLDVFDDRVFIKKRVYQYLYYYKKRYWQDSTKKPFPAIILVLPTQNIKQRIYSFIQKTLPEDSPAFYLTTKEDIQTTGMSPEILTKVVSASNTIGD